jgi:hypothetical protein
MAPPIPPLRAVERFEDQRQDNGGDGSGGRQDSPEFQRGRWIVQTTRTPPSKLVQQFGNSSGLPAELLSGRTAHWVDGIARLEIHQVPRDVPAYRWRQFINDCHAFLLAKENWAERAAGLGWNDRELFGCCRRPLERLGNAGLLWAINGGRLVELRRDWAVIERASDRSRHVHHRERPKAANITLPWIGLRISEDRQ